MLAFLYYFNFETLMDIVISYLNFNLKYHDKCSLANNSNLFSLEVVQKMRTLPISCITGKLECQKSMRSKRLRKLCLLGKLLNETVNQCEQR